MVHVEQQSNLNGKEMKSNGLPTNMTADARESTPDAIPDLSNSVEPSSPGFLTLPKDHFNTVPLKQLVQNFLYQANNELNTLVDVLESQHGDDKKQSLLNYVQAQRDRLMKVLVLVKWSAKASSIQKCQNIIAFLNAQNQLFNQTVNDLYEFYQTIPTSRVRNYDVINAVDVLTTGSFNRLPKIIKEQYIKPEPLHGDEVLNTLSMVNDFIQLKLISIENIPEWLVHTKHIENAKLTFTVKNEYEIVLTLRGLDTSLPWHLVTLRILVNQNRLNEDSRSILTAGQQSQLEYIVQQKLLPPHLKQYPPGVPVPEPPASPNKNAKKDDITMLHEFLHNFCGTLMLENLHLQAVSLLQLTWNGQLQLPVNRNSNSITVNYWVAKGAPSFKETHADLGNLGQHNFTISLGSNVQPPFTTWVHEKYILTNPFFSEFPSEMFKVDPSCLDFEKILLEIVRAHSVLILNTYRDLILKANRGYANFTPHQVQLHNLKDEVPYLSVSYGFERSAKLTVDPRSGKVNLLLVNDSDRQSVASEVEKKLNQNPDNASNLMIELRFFMLLEDIKFISTFCDLLPLSSNPFKTGEMNHFGSNVKRVLFLQFSSHPQYHMVFGASDYALHCWIVIIELNSSTQKRVISCVKEIPINDLESDIIKDIGENPLNFFQVPTPTKQDLWDIQRLKSLSQLGLELAAYLKIEPQLISGLPLLFQGEETHLKSFLPTLNNPVKESMFEFTPHHSPHLPSPIPGWVGPITILQDCSDRKSVSFRIRLNNSAFPTATSSTNTPLTLPNHWSIDTSGTNLTFVYFDLNDCWNSFVSDWAIFTHVASLTHQIYFNHWFRSVNFEIYSYTCNSLVLTYNNGQFVGITWKSESPHNKGEYYLDFSTNSTDSKNPFLLTQPFLHSYLNRTKSLRGLLHIIQDTFHLVNGVDRHELEGKRKCSVIPRSENQFRVIYPYKCAFDLTLLKDNTIAFTYVSQNNTDTDSTKTKIVTPQPWKPETISPEAKSSWIVNQHLVPEYNQLFHDLVIHIPKLLQALIPNGNSTNVAEIESQVIKTKPENTFFLLLAVDWFFCNINLLRYLHAWDRIGEEPKISPSVDFSQYTAKFETPEIFVKLGLQKDLCKWYVELTFKGSSFSTEEQGILRSYTENQLNDNTYNAMLVSKGIVLLLSLPLSLLKMVIGCLHLKSSQNDYTISLQLIPATANIATKVIDYNNVAGTLNLLFKLSFNNHDALLPIQYNSFSKEITITSNESTSLRDAVQIFDQLRNEPGFKDSYLDHKIKLFIERFAPSNQDQDQDTEYF